MSHAPLKLDACEHRLCVHGHAVRIHCDVPALNWPIHHCLGEFSTPDWPDGFSPAPGTVGPYDESIVMRHLSPEAVAIASGDELTELYEHGERFWLVDDRWGLCEVNLLKGEWHSWILHRPRVSGLQVVDSAVLWPMAQVLALKGLTLVPAVSITRGGFGAMIISPFGLGSELNALISAGWGIVGQRWTALREDDGRIAMLRLPGAVEQTGGRQHNGSVQSSVQGASRPLSDWTDLTAERPAAAAHHSFADAIILIDAARRGSAAMKPVRGSTAAATLKRAWPIFELRNQPRTQQMPVRLAAECAIFEGHLSRRAEDFVVAMDRVAETRIPRPGKIQSQVMPSRERRQIPA